MSTTTALTSIGQISVNAKDMPRAVRFYRDTLGVRHLFDAGPTMSFFDCGGVRLMIGVAERPEFDHPASVLYYKVADIAATYQELTSKGVVFVDAPHRIATLPDHELWMTFFHDSESNLLALMSEIRT